MTREESSGTRKKLEKNSKKLERDFGELDCISRQAVLELIADYDLSMGQVEWSDQLIKVSEAVDIIRNLPSVSPQEQRWISVSERLPKIADVYRVTRYYPNNVMNPNYLVDACFFDGSNTWYNDNRINHERAHADNVIAWQENPEPYKVEPQESEDKP